MDRILVIGGGYAGVLAALRAARALAGRGEVVLVSEQSALVERIRLHERAASRREIRRSIPELVAGTGVRFVEARAEALDTARREVRLSGGTSLSYGKLVLALGSVAGASRIPGAAEHALGLDVGGADALADRLDAAAREGRTLRVLVVGGGLTGLELASELAETRPGARVTLATSGVVGERLSPRALAHARRALARLGVENRERLTIERFEAGAAVAAGERFPFDVCVAASGFSAPAILRSWGLAVDEHGRVRTDATLAALGAPDVFVAGDCAAPTGTLGSPLTAGCKTAMPMGAHAGTSAARALCGEPVRPFAWLDTGLCISLGRRDAVVQVMNAAGQPRSLYFRGALGARIKEWICRYTVRSLELERDDSFHYRWLRPRASSAPRSAPALPAEAA